MNTNFLKKLLKIFKKLLLYTKKEWVLTQAEKYIKNGPRLEN